MKKLILMTNLFLLGACSKSTTETKKESEVVDVNNAATRYVGQLQSDVKLAETNANRMNRSIERSEQAINQVVNPE